MNPPELLLFQDFGGDWNRYEEELNRVFKEKIVHGGLRFQNKRVSYRRIPETKGRWASFWHLIQEGHEEDERIYTRFAPLRTFTLDTMGDQQHYIISRD